MAVNVNVTTHLFTVARCKRVVYRKMIPLPQHRLCGVELRGTKEAALSTLGDAGEGTKAVTLQEMYESQILIYICCRMGRGDDVLHSHEPEQEDYHGARCHVLHMRHVGAYRLDGASEVLVEVQYSTIATGAYTLGGEEQHLGTRLTIALYHVGCMLKVACYRHLMPALRQGMHGIKCLYFSSTC